MAEQSERSKQVSGRATEGQMFADELGTWALIRRENSSVGMREAEY